MPSSIILDRELNKSEVSNKAKQNNNKLNVENDAIDFTS